MALVTRASRSKRVRRAPKLPDFELEELPRSPIRKKPRPKGSHEKSAASKKVMAIEEEGEAAAAAVMDNVMGLGAVEELVGAVGGSFEFDEVMRGLAPHFDGAVQPEDVLSHEDPMLLPQFDPGCAPRTLGPWSSDEDEMLASIVGKFGARHWMSIAKRMDGRTGKQCRERWHNHLDPDISKCAWTDEEDMAIQLGVSELGHKWSAIAARLPGRTDNAVKNRYKARVKKMGGAAIVSILRKGQRVSDADFLHELVRRNVLAEEERKPGTFSPGQIEALASDNVTTVVNAAGCRWSNQEHSQLTRSIPKNTPLNDVDWVAASSAVTTRSALACRRHWESYLRGGWKPVASKKRDRDRDPEPEPEPELEAETVPELQTKRADLLTAYVNDPDLALVAIEPYSEGAAYDAWSHSSVLVVGKPWLSFHFHTPGTAAQPPPPPPPPPPPLPVVVARPVCARPLLETEELADWMKQKAQAVSAEAMAKRERLQQEGEAEALQTKQRKDARERAKQMNALKKMNAYFHSVKSQDAFATKGRAYAWPALATSALA